MPKRDIVVVGASAGGVVALKQFVQSLPAGFNGSVFIVLHIPPYSPSRLAEILNKAGHLQAIEPKDGEKIQSGKIYVAAPDNHLLLEEGRVIVKKGPKENRFRPSVDALFRSAAYVYGPRVIGIVLSGALNDGTSGLWSVKRMGGLCIIQEPDEATFPDMPVNVTEYVETDYSLPVDEMGPLLHKLTGEAASKEPDNTAEEMKRLKMEVIIATRDNAFEMGILEMGELTTFTCPECHGALVRLLEGKIIRYRCHTGHAFTASALLAGITTVIEENLWQAMRGMEEATMILEQIGEHFENNDNPSAGKLFLKKSKETAERARVIHDSTFKQESMSEDIRYGKNGH